MTQEEFAILQMAEAIREADRWESYCEGCKFLGNATWHFADRTGKTHYCNHPDRQDGHHDPRPPFCNNILYIREPPTNLRFAGFRLHRGMPFQKIGSSILSIGVIGSPCRYIVYS